MKSRRVLVVEDEQSARDACERYLKIFGHDVAVAADAEEALALAKDRPPDVVICDWRLGGGPDGAHVARELQRRFDCSVIFVTAHPIDKLREATPDINVKQYMRKPVQLASVVKAIDEAFD
jgi:DNA-binding response OmpR family regulator